MGDYADYGSMELSQLKEVGQLLPKHLALCSVKVEAKEVLRLVKEGCEKATLVSFSKEGKMIEALVRVHSQNPYVFSSWENEFLDSINKQVVMGRKLSDKQTACLERMHAKHTGEQTWTQNF